MLTTLRTCDALRTPSGRIAVYCGRNRRDKAVLLVHDPDRGVWRTETMLPGLLDRCAPATLPEGLRCPL